MGVEVNDGFVYSVEHNQQGVVTCLGPTFDRDVIHEGQTDGSLAPELHITPCSPVCLYGAAAEQFCWPVVVVGAVLQSFAAHLTRLFHFLQTQVQVSLHWVISTLSVETIPTVGPTSAVGLDTEIFACGSFGLGAA